MRLTRVLMLSSMVFISSIVHAGMSDRTFTFINRCPQSIWVGALNNPRYPLPSGGGWKLNPGGTRAITLPKEWGGRFWGRTGCPFTKSKQNGGACETGDCGSRKKCNGNGGQPPVSLAEFTLSGWAGKDFYDISLVDGYNLPMKISPHQGTFTKTNPNDIYDCGIPSCVDDLNKTCPTDLQVRNATGEVISCRSACEKYNTDEYCCRGAYGTPDKCPATSYSRAFKAACPTAYSYAYDDQTSTYVCSGKDYDITFCPHI